MGEVVQLDDHRAHLCVTGSDRNVHVVPVQTALDIAAGKLPCDALPDEVWQTVMLQWLLSLDVPVRGSAA